MLRKNDGFHYGQKCASDHAVESWNELVQRAGRTKGKDESGKVKRESLSFSEQSVGLIEDLDRFNRENIFRKKGWAMMPVCFGISFTNTSMNQARALVHIYQDGSVSVSTGAIEMGQGVNTKLSQVAALTLGIDNSWIRVETTNTRRVANTSPTAASSGSDLNGKATQIACTELLNRLKKQAAVLLGAEEKSIIIQDDWVFKANKKTKLGWEELVKETFLSRQQLSAVGHYATPEIHFDKTKEKGHPFAYHVFGTALTIVEVDTLCGTYEIEEVQIVHDFGKSMNELIDLGQVEGALLQGIGWMTLEELLYDKQGRLLADSLSKYKVPDIYMAPKIVETTALETEGEPLAILRSKAVGEPPFMYGIGSYFAIQKAIMAFNPKYKPVFNAPMTPEKVLLGLYE